MRYDCSCLENKLQGPYCKWVILITMVECISVTNILALVSVNKGSHFYSSGKQQKQLYGSSHGRSNGYKKSQELRVYSIA